MNKDSIIKLFAYIAVSARGCIDEPKIYGPFRLVDSLSKLFYLFQENNLLNDKEIERIIKKIDEKKYTCMTDEQEFTNMLDEIINDLVIMTGIKKND